MSTSFKGNKSFLPSKVCVVCKKEMTWRKSWAKNWESVNIAQMLAGKKHLQCRHKWATSFLLRYCFARARVKTKEKNPSTAVEISTRILLFENEYQL